MLITKLLLAHILGDFVFQPKKWVVHKEVHKIKSKYLYFHILIHFTLTLLLLGNIKYWKIALIIAGSHLLIDILKLYTAPLFHKQAIPFLLDQCLHLLVLYLCAYHSNLLEHSLYLYHHINWALVTALVFVTYPASIIMNVLLERMSKQISLDHKSLQNAGKYIGILERLFVFVFIVMGRWEAIGFLIAAKSVFRFNDLKETNNRKLTEYILIGTLLSFGMALMTGILYTSNT
ncbi:DUF3307 domain-containing protein [Eudoraea chungangensis]|uniref:DUF3307 domain-containing protein n=1 Tax=Eudoraea chungangensis TaxID=1481905 RepID=UPI0023EBF9F0|nr:DUF3307 domain-containing protein [Eudoraea chungangensis]